MIFKNCSFDWLNPLVIGLIDSLDSLTTTSISVSLAINDVWSSILVDHILNLPRASLVCSWFATGKALLILSFYIQAAGIVVATCQVWACHPSINLKSSWATSNLVWQMFLQSKVILAFGSGRSEFISHLEMVRSLISFEFIFFLNRLSELLVHIVVAVRSLILTYHRLGTSSLSRMSQVFITKLKMMTFQICFHLSVLFYIFTSIRAKVWIKKLITLFGGTLQLSSILTNFDAWLLEICEEASFLASQLILLSQITDVLFVGWNSRLKHLLIRNPEVSVSHWIYCHFSIFTCFHHRFLRNRVLYHSAHVVWNII